MTSVTKVESASVQDVKYTRPRDDEQDERVAKVQRTKEEALSSNEASIAKPQDVPERKIEPVGQKTAETPTEPQPSTAKGTGTGGIINGAKKAVEATVNVTGQVIKKTVENAPRFAKIAAAGAIACPNEYTATAAAITGFASIPEVQELAGESAQASINFKFT